MAPAPAAAVPLTLLSGFLGAGKMTLLRRVLEGGELGRVGCVVNDVAEVNIDAKLVKRTERAVAGGKGGGEADAGFDSVELDNGCVCCSAGDDLFQALAKLLGLAKRRGYAYERLVWRARAWRSRRTCGTAFRRPICWASRYRAWYVWTT